jgi:hypothetical protein
LKNTRTNAVRSYIADDEGNYRFSGLDPNVDYEIHAEKDGAKSTTRTISSFDNKKEIVIPLKIEKKKAGRAASIPRSRSRGCARRWICC